MLNSKEPPVPPRSYRNKRGHGQIEELQHYRNRPSIDELPSPLRLRARQWWNDLVAQARKRGRRLDSWYVAILWGQAKRLARTTPEERTKWGRSMHSRRGGLAVQRKYREEGRTGGNERGQSWRIEHLNACRKRQRELGRKLTPREKAEIFSPMFRKDLPR
jgi:hypothetical protein